jgi:hypothetical protein
LAAARALPTDALRFRDSRFFKSPEFAKAFNQLSLSKEVRPLVRELCFGNRFFPSWTQERRSHPADTFSCISRGEAFADATIAEAAEHKIQEQQSDVTILSAPGSNYEPGGTLDLIRVSSGEQASLRNVITTGVMAWLASTHGDYDRTSSTAPKDYETVLQKDQNRFRATGRVSRKEGGRRIFEELATGRLFYVDGAHFGHHAHLEVFLATGEHLGKADIDSGNLVPNSRRPDRYVRL